MCLDALGGQAAFRWHHSRFVQTEHLEEQHNLLLNERMQRASRV